MVYKVKRGFKLNPNKKLVDAITKRIYAAGGECPCFNEGEDKTCPCSDYLMNDNCHCNLYVRADHCPECSKVVFDEYGREIDDKYCCMCGVKFAE